MIKYIIRRCLLMIPTLIAISILSFLIIKASPGDFLDSYIANLESFGEIVDPAQ